MKIFGREPTLWLAFLTALLSLAGTLGFRLLTPDLAELWNLAILAVAGAVTAFAVRPIAPAAFTYAVAAVAQLTAGYGLNLTPEQLGMIQALVVPVLALLTREQVTPQNTAVSRTTEAAGKPEVQTVSEGKP